MTERQRSIESFSAVWRIIPPHCPLMGYKLKTHTAHVFQPTTSPDSRDPFYRRFTNGSLKKKKKNPLLKLLINCLVSILLEPAKVRVNWSSIFVPHDAALCKRWERMCPFPLTMCLISDFFHIILLCIYSIYDVHQFIQMYASDSKFPFTHPHIKNIVQIIGANWI